MNTKHIFPWNEAPEWAEWAWTKGEGLSCWSNVFPTNRYDPKAKSIIFRTPDGIVGRIEQRPSVFRCDAISSVDKQEPVNNSTPLDRQEGGNHYKNFQIQPVEFCQKNKLGFCESSVVKYVSRHKEKNGAQDIRKAIHFLELLLQLEYGETK